jgi:hypothetical protein
VTIYKYIMQAVVKHVTGCELLCDCWECEMWEAAG